MNHKPENTPTLSPYLIVDNVPAVIAFLHSTFDTETRGILHRPNGTLMHAEVQLQDSVVMLGEPMGGMRAQPSHLFVYVDGAEQTFKRAIDAGGKVYMEMSDMKHSGVKYGGVEDPSGNVWWIGEMIEEISWNEQQVRINAMSETWSNEK